MPLARRGGAAPRPPGGAVPLAPGAFVLAGAKQNPGEPREAVECRLRKIAEDPTAPSIAAISVFPDCSRDRAAVEEGKGAEPGAQTVPTTPRTAAEGNGGDTTGEAFRLWQNNVDCATTVRQTFDQLHKRTSGRTWCEDMTQAQGHDTSAPMSPLSNVASRCSNVLRQQAFPLHPPPPTRGPATPTGGAECRGILPTEWPTCLRWLSGMDTTRTGQ